MLKTIFKILIVIFIIGLIFVGVMWAMQPTGSLGKKQASIVPDKKNDLKKAKGEATKLLRKVKLPLIKKEDEKKDLKEKQKKFSPPKVKSKNEHQNNEPAYKFPKKLGADRLTYTLHIDAFLFKEFADQLIVDLKRKKYPAYGVSVWGDERQLWHAVRIGRYFDHETADKELTNFNLKERRSAKVINLGTLEFFPPAYLDPEKNENKETKNNSDSEKKSAKSDKIKATNKNNLKG